MCHHFARSRRWPLQTHRYRSCTHRRIIIYTHHFIALVFDQLDEVAEFEQRVGDDHLVVVLGADALKTEGDQTVRERFLAPG